MRIGEKLRQAITSSFIEVKLDENQNQPSENLPVEAAPFVPAYVEPIVPEPYPLPEPVQVRLPEPEPLPVVDPLTPPNLTGALRPDGSLNDEVIYSSIAPLPIAFTAEQAITVLVELPYGTTTRGRCQAMQQAIRVVTDDPASTGHLVVSDAAQKMVALNQHLTQGRTALKSFRQKVAEEMEQLHDRMNQLRLVVDESNANFQAIEEAGRVRVDNLTGIIAFFDEFQAYLRMETSSQTDNSELPAFMRDDTAMKLLNMQNKKEAA